MANRKMEKKNLKKMFSIVCSASPKMLIPKKLVNVPLKTLA
eukprot:CAMPEP_0168568908 /NCGR_PEP_ID=MMETSP0413-20121227/15840_1 /TAXON_ID=136452 /ORGANISM="Filamoeba nolandi, Strain NC-AS-23-1" /LENGTH=40 /DNA_ID= /DNA_START= /DNA_END= /DNA_ORIENTATION=